LDFNSVLIISDCHLCAANCQIDILINVLEKHKSNIELLVINGDLFDSLDKRIPKKHWKFLNLIRKLSDDIDIYWVLGNHDKPHPEIIASILGITAVDHFQFRSGGNTFFCIHGDEFDDFITKNKFITWLADKFYQFLQYIDTSHFLAKFSKKTSKTFLRCKDKIKEKSLNKYGHEGIVVTGHTHFAENDGKYINCGCFTELPCSYVLIQNGEISLIEEGKI